ncbi:MAG: hypothetical protein WKF73_07250 [Nocardioidaceae bacterium]
MARDKANLDITWLRDESLEDMDNLPAPEIIAREIVEDLTAALRRVRGSGRSPGRNTRSITTVSHLTWDSPSLSIGRAVAEREDENRVPVRPAVTFPAYEMSTPLHDAFALSNEMKASDARPQLLALKFDQAPVKADGRLIFGRVGSTRWV